MPYWSYDIRLELFDKLSIISYFPSTFCPTLGHHQWRMYNKSDVTFICTLLLCKNKHLYCCICSICSRHQLYGHLPPIMKTIQVRRTRHAEPCWRSKDEFISDVLLWTPAYGQAKAGRPAQTYIQQLCEDMGCNPEDLPKAMNDREKWRERVRDICAGGMTWWWWHVAFTFRICLYN